MTLSFSGEVFNDKGFQVFRNFFFLATSQNHAFVDVFPKLISACLLFLPTKIGPLPDVLKDILIDSAPVLSFGFLVVIV